MLRNEKNPSSPLTLILEEEPDGEEDVELIPVDLIRKGRAALSGRRVILRLWRDQRRSGGSPKYAFLPPPPPPPLIQIIQGGV